MDQICATLQRIPRKTGIYVQGNRFYKDNAVYKGIGVNHWALLLNTWLNMNGTGSYGDAGAALDVSTMRNDWELPFARISATPFAASDQTAIHSDASTWLGHFDALVSKCEDEDFGLIVTLSWALRNLCAATYEIHGVYSPPATLADKTSTAWMLFEEFVTTIVARYKNSNAIFGWEIANEPNLTLGHEYNPTWNVDGTNPSYIDWGARPDGGSWQTTDKMSMVQWRTFSQNAIQLIRGLDPYGRFISPGTSYGNAFAMAAQTSATPVNSTYAQWDAGINTLNWPHYRDQNFEVMSLHTYPTISGTNTLFYEDFRTHSELVQVFKHFADDANVPLFVGEFGANYLDPTGDKSSTSAETEVANFAAMLDAIVSNDVPLAAAWNYGGNASGSTSWQKWLMTTESRKYQLAAIRSVNRTIA